MKALAARAVREARGLQYAALPFRRDDTLEVLLVTSRGTGRWVLPKGWPMRGRSRRAAAAMEALEEAGVVGEVGKAAIGEYDYVKTMDGAPDVPCRVTVYPLRVTGQKQRWREQGQRECRWFDAEAAAEAVAEPELAVIIRRFAQAQTPPGAEGG